VIIDEVQYAPTLLRYLKVAVDADRLPKILPDERSLRIPGWSGGHHRTRDSVPGGNLQGSLFFWRDRTREVDFVVEVGGRLELLEAKWTEAPSVSDAVNLEFVRRTVEPTTVSGSGIVCRARHGYPLGEDLRVVSIAELDS
jgi:predicted AAA+ superfamily ATPase